MKVGDRVKVIKTIYVADELQVGCTGVIVESPFKSIEVRMDSGYADIEGDDTCRFTPTNWS